MADFLDNLFSSNGCNVDGTVSNNPLNRLVDGIYNNFEAISDNLIEQSEIIYDNDSNVYYDNNINNFNNSLQMEYSSDSYVDNNSMDLIWNQNAVFNNNQINTVNHNYVNNNANYFHPFPMQNLYQPYNSLQYIEPQEHAYETDQETYNNNQEVDLERLDESIVLGQGLNNNEVKEILQNFNEQQAYEKSLNKQAYHDSWQNTLNNLKDNFDEYSYIHNNPYKELSNIDYFNQGMELYNNGKVNEAILAFEAEVQINEENSDCWNMLGICHGENDEDAKAIQCHKKTLEYDQYNLNSLLALGISYCNEMDSVNALESLKAWVKHNPMFYGLEIQPDEYSDGTLIDEVVQLMLEVSRLSPNDVDVKIVLGVLYNVTEDYTNAVECFEFALKERPNDYSLYNKLGATLANSNRSTAAISYYVKALEIRPSYARGWLNLGIAYANLNKHEYAAKAYVQALHLNPSAKHIWGYLRTILVSMREYKLVELTNNEDVNKIAELLRVNLINN